MSHKELAVIILAAGQGSRMKSDTPKVLHKVAGVPMISHIIQTAESLDPKKIIVVLAPGMDEVEGFVHPHSVAIQKKAQGTADAVKAGLAQLEKFRGDVLVLLGDAPLITAKTLKGLIKAKQSNDEIGLSVLGVELDDPTGYGRILFDENGQVYDIVEEKDASREQKAINVINTGAFCLDCFKLQGWIKRVTNNNAQKEYYFTDIPAIATRLGSVATLAVAKDANEVRGVNSRIDLAEIEQIMQDRLRAEAMSKGVTMIDPKSVTLALDTKFAKDVLIEPNVFFGPGVSVGSGTIIRSFSHIEGAKIGKDVTVGPFARLRPGTELGEEVRIGNFVEVKKSKIGKRSKISHLGYVGDCTMGDDVNFSAGAITVNYDGFEKHQTKIGHGVMIGSNVNLVAPLTIDNGAFVAAGSTITEDVPKDALSISRDVHKIREGWAAEYRKKKGVK